MRLKRSIVPVITVTALAIGGLAVANAGSSSNEEPVDGDNGLTAESAAEYEGVVFTNTTPEEAISNLGQRIAEFEREAEEAVTAVGQTDAEAQEQAASYLEKAAYLQGVVQLICEQEASVDC